MAKPKIKLVELSDPGRGNVAFGVSPGGRDDPDDRWHKLHGRCTTPFGSWEFTDECLLHSEVVAWVGWLQGIADLSERSEEDARIARYPESPITEIAFLEPELSMELRACGAGWLRIRIGTSWNAAPPRLRTGAWNYWEDGPLWMDICVPKDQARRLAESIHEQGMS